VSREPAGLPAFEKNFLVFLFVDDDGLEVFGFHDQTAVKAFHIIHAVTPGNDYSAVMLANRWHGLHKADYGFILTVGPRLSSPKIDSFYPKNQ
jgi:hypothetical protein